MQNHFWRSQRCWTLYALILTLCCGSRDCYADQLEDLAQRVGVRVLFEATSDRAAQDQAESRMPYGKMSPGARQRARKIIDQASQYRRMPCLQYQVDPAIYRYLVAQPDVAISTWRVMGISKLQMTQAADFEFDASSPDGSYGEADVLWRDANQCVFIVAGAYRTPLLPSTIHASALVWLRYRFVNDENGKPLVNQQVETFLHFPSGAIDTIARLASGVTNTILDRNVFEVSLYARMMSRAAETEPEWIEQLAQRMDGVAPQRRIELVRVSRGDPWREGRMSPATVPQRHVRTDGLRNSGEFKVFEQSLVQVNTHVPIVRQQGRHEPPSSQQIGDSIPLLQSSAAAESPTSRSPSHVVLPTFSRDKNLDRKATSDPSATPLVVSFGHWEREGTPDSDDGVRLPSTGPVQTLRPISSRRSVGATASSKPTESGHVPVAASRMAASPVEVRH